MGPSFAPISVASPRPTSDIAVHRCPRFKDILPSNIKPAYDRWLSSRSSGYDSAASNMRWVPSISARSQSQIHSQPEVPNTFTTSAHSCVLANSCTRVKRANLGCQEQFATEYSGPLLRILWNAALMLSRSECAGTPRAGAWFDDCRAGKVDTMKRSSRVIWYQTSRTANTSSGCPRAAAHDGTKVTDFKRLSCYYRFRVGSLWDN